MAKKADSGGILRGYIALHVRRDEWCLGTLYAPGSDKGTRVAGLVPANIEEGDLVELMGAMQVHPKYGPQFKIEAVIAHLPGDARGIAEWLIDRFPQIGPQRAQEVVQRFGNKLWTVLEEKPQMLLEIQGINQVRLDEILSAYRAFETERETAIALVKLGLSITEAGKAIRLWGTVNVMGQLEANPYSLFFHVSMSFEAVDKIALKHFNVALDDPRRVGACITHKLHKALENGDCCMIKHTLVQAVHGDLRLPYNDVAAQLENFTAVYDKQVMPRDIDQVERNCASKLLGLHNG